MSYAAYEHAKAQWLRQHPDATPAQIEEAFRQIAKRLGL